MAARPRLLAPLLLLLLPACATALLAGRRHAHRRAHAPSPDAGREDADAPAREPSPGRHGHLRAASASANIESRSRVVSGGRLKALIVGATRGYHNYRHEATALAIYDLLLSRGYPSGDMIVMTSGDVASHPLNPIRGVVSPITRRDVWYRVDPKKGDGGDSGVFLGESVTSRNFVAALTGDPSKLDGAGAGARKAATLTTSPEDHLLVFFSGYAALGHLAFPTWPEDVLWRTELRDALKAVLATRVLFVVDTPYAASVVADPIPHNVVVWVSTASNEVGHASGCACEMDERTGERTREPRPCDANLFGGRLMATLAEPTSMEELDFIGMFETVRNYTAPLQNSTLQYAEDAWSMEDIATNYPPMQFFGQPTKKEIRERAEAVERGEVILESAADNPEEQAEVWRKALELDRTRGVVASDIDSEFSFARELFTAQMRGKDVIGKSESGDKFDYEYEDVKMIRNELKRNITDLEHRLFKDSQMMGFENLRGKLRNPPGIFDYACYRDYFRTWAGTCGALGDLRMAAELNLELPGSLSSACYFKLRAMELGRILLHHCGAS